jgi:DNA-binding MarR family transcriptional regulator
MSVDPQGAGRLAPTSRRRGYGSLLVRIAKLALTRAEAALRPLDLTPLAYETMICIAEGDGLSQKELSDRLNRYAPKMVGVIDALEKRGLVERKVSEADRRRRRLVLTPKGHGLLLRAGAVAATLEEELFGSLPDQDKSRFEALARRLEAGEGKREAE